MESSSELDVNLFDPATQEDWFPTYRRLRDEAPVYRMPGTQMFVVTRYDDVMSVLRHQDVFPTGAGITRSDTVRRIYDDTGWERITPLSVNPPEHRRYRDLVDRHFDAKGSERWRTVVEDTVDELIDAFVADGKTEFVSAFALPLPVRMITRILGFPATDIGRLKAWSTAWVLPFSGPLTDEQEVWVAENVVEFQHYIHDQIQLRRAAIADGDPGDDVLTSLVSATFDDPARSVNPNDGDSHDGDSHRPLSDHEIITIVDHLYIGGNETTTFALTSALWILLRGDEYGSPGLYERVRDDRTLLVPFIEEALRLESPTQGLYRRVAVDTELGGVALPAGSVVHIRYAAANRDERRFAEPDHVVLDRPNGRRHLAFSLGEHHCPGEGLSRFEQRIALDRVLDRLPDLRLAPANTFTHAPGFVLRALDELHLEWTPPSP